jgi:hypothetical protein
LPDNKTYEFKYNNYGELVWIKVPSGARYEYTWASATGTGGGGYDGTLVLREVTEKRTYIDGTTSTILSKMTFDRDETTDCQPLSSMAGTVATVTHFDGPSTEAGREKHYYCGVPGDSADADPWDYATWKRGREYKTEVLNLSTVVRSTKLTWAQRPSAGEPIWWGTLDDDDAPPNDPRVSASEQTLHDATPNLVAKQEFGYDQYNNRTDILEYDYNQLTTPIRRTHLEYSTASAYVNVGPHLRGMVTKRWLCGSGAGNCTEGAAVANTEFVYDASTILSRSNATGHDTGAFGTSYTTRGNITTLRQWRNLPTAKWIETDIEYDILGNPWKTIDPLDNVTQAQYGNSFTTSVPELIGSQAPYAFPSSFTNALNQSVSIVYDYYLGRPITFVDPNNVWTYREFNDPLDRLTKVLQAYNVPADIHQTRFAYLENLYGKKWLVEVYGDQYAFDDERHLTRTA